MTQAECGAEKQLSTGGVARHRHSPAVADRRYSSGRKSGSPVISAFGNDSVHAAKSPIGANSCCYRHGKGVFLYQSDESARNGKLTGPHLSGWEIFSLCGDSRNGRILAGTGSFAHGSSIRVSKDFGKTWKGVKRDPAFAKGSKAELKHIWQNRAGPRVAAGHVVCRRG